MLLSLHFFDSNNSISSSHQSYPLVNPPSFLVLYPQPSSLFLKLPYTLPHLPDVVSFSKPARPLLFFPPSKMFPSSPTFAANLEVQWPNSTQLSCLKLEPS